MTDEEKRLIKLARCVLRCKSEMVIVRVSINSFLGLANIFLHS